MNLRKPEPLIYWSLLRYQPTGNRDNVFLTITDFTRVRNTRDITLRKRLFFAKGCKSLQYSEKFDRTGYNLTLVDIDVRKLSHLARLGRAPYKC